METEKLRHIFLLFFLLWCGNVFSQIADVKDSTTSIPSQNQQIQLKTFVESSKVPVNRPVVFRIELSWIGNLGQYHIEPVPLPVLTNLVLEGSGSENRLEPQAGGKTKAIKAFTYQLRPLEMGMAYIDGVVIKYVDTQSTEEDKLTSQRVMVEIIEPIPDGKSGVMKSVGYLFLILIPLLILLYFVLRYFRKKKAAREITPPIPLAEIYLDKLAHEVDPRGTNLGEMVSRLSRIFREYLDNDFGIHTRESNTTEIIEQLSTTDLDEVSKTNLEGVFKKLDLIKFAGKNVDPASFTNIYGAIESFLLKRKDVQISRQAEEKEAK